MTMDILFEFDARCSLFTMEMATGTSLMCEIDPERKVLVQNS